MRYFLLFAALWLFSGVAVASPTPADTAVLRINHLPADGLMLSKGWRYHVGDDPVWARPNFDDSRWDTIALAHRGQLLPPRALAGIGWFRLRLRPADSLRNQALGLQIGRLLGAVEVYLNGRLVGGYGTVSANPDQVRAGYYPVYLALPLAGAPDQVLALRFAPWLPPRLLRNYLAQSQLQKVELSLQKQSRLRQAEGEAQIENAIYAVLGGITLLLGLLHLALFYYHPVQRANRYFAFYTLALAVATLPVLNANWAELAVGVGAASLRIGALLLGTWCALRALYALFGARPGYLYVGLGVSLPIILAYVMLGALRDSAGGFVCPIVFVALATSEQLRLTVGAARQRRRGAALIGAGFAAGLGFWLIILLVGADQWTARIVLRTTITALALLAPVISISLHLAREFALDSQLLQVKLGEVERLSAQTIAQKQEKQALLAAQNEMLEQQVQQRTGELQRSLADLRTTQAQLIQKEKMASLGELTAGIAHEIQNPLNFVNNFSEVSTELLEELEEEQAKPRRDAGLEAELVGDLRHNLGKITEHGKRAAAIVRGMLEHSRTSTGERAPTDLNALTDEYLRLAYQGLRAKDKSFNAALATDFEPDLPQVEAVAGDLGRVLLNLFSNAFYAVQKRQQAGAPGYAPTIRVSTKRVGDTVKIRVTDNGTGISPEVQAKIFQPFFTTKPTGEGTGLGLSLSHDIIAQGHGGTLSVDSHDGRGTDFIISLPA